MPSELIKLKVKPEAATGSSADVIRNKFIEACLYLDASILELIIAEDQYFDDIDKYRFLASLKQQFDWAIKRGAKDIRMARGKCEMCVLGHATYEFYGQKKTPEFAYIINTNKGEIHDIFLCNLSSGWGMKIE